MVKDRNCLDESREKRHIKFYATSDYKTEDSSDTINVDDQKVDLQWKKQELVKRWVWKYWLVWILCRGCLQISTYISY